MRNEKRYLLKIMLILVGIIILNTFVYKYLDARNRIISIKTKLVIGMILASLTMFIAGMVEISRQKSGCTSNIYIYAYICIDFC